MSTPHRTRTTASKDDAPADDDDEKELSEEVLNRLKSFCTDLFDRVICNEAHKLKAHRTKTHRAIKLLNARCRVLLSATPMINRPLDLVGLMSLLWDEAPNPATE